jgi:hypothetical protein
VGPGVSVTWVSLCASDCKARRHRARGIIESRFLFSQGVCESAVSVRPGVSLRLGHLRGL